MYLQTQTKNRFNTPVHSSMENSQAFDFVLIQTLVLLWCKSEHSAMLLNSLRTFSAKVKVNCRLTAGLMAAFRGIANKGIIWKCSVHHFYAGGESCIQHAFHAWNERHMEGWAHPGGRPYSPTFWVGVCHTVLKTLTLFQTKMYDFQTPFQTWPQKSIPLFRPDP